MVCFVLDASLWRVKRNPPPRIRNPSDSLLWLACRAPGLLSEDLKPDKYNLVLFLRGYGYSARHLLDGTPPRRR